MVGEIIFVAVLAFIAGAIGWHLYQSKFVRTTGTGKSETGENGIEVKDNPKEKTEKRT